MNFEEWFEYERQREGSSYKWDNVATRFRKAKEAWDFQQLIIDELQCLNALQDKHIAELQAKLRARYGSNEGIDEPKLSFYTVVEWVKMVEDAEKQLEGDCPLLEDEVIVDVNKLLMHYSSQAREGFGVGDNE